MAMLLPEFQIDFQTAFYQAPSVSDELLFQWKGSS